MKYFAVILILWVMQPCLAQPVNKKIYPVGGKRITLEILESSVTIEGYEGTDLIIQADTVSTDDQFDMQKVISALATGKLAEITLKSEVMAEDAKSISVRIPEGNYRYLTVRVPQNAYLKLSYQVKSPYGKVSLTDLYGELELEGTVQFMNISRIAGPLSLAVGKQGDFGGVAQKIILTDIKWNNGAISIPKLNLTTSSGDIDLSLPQDLRATIQINSGYGDLYSDLDIREVAQTYPLVRGKFVGRVNGGGQPININTTYGNIFLRAQK